MESESPWDWQKSSDEALRKFSKGTLVLILIGLAVLAALGALVWLLRRKFQKYPHSQVNAWWILMYWMYIPTLYWIGYLASFTIDQNGYLIIQNIKYVSILTTLLFLGWSFAMIRRAYRVALWLIIVVFLLSSVAWEVEVYNFFRYGFMTAHVATSTAALAGVSLFLRMNYLYTQPNSLVLKSRAVQPSTAKW